MIFQPILSGISVSKNAYTGLTHNKQHIRFPSPTFTLTNDITLAIYSIGQGLPVIFCHGFPELAFSWRHQLEATAKAGFNAIAPDLRGFGLSDSPKEISAYSITEVCDDLTGMMDYLGLKKAVFCGHDWGQFVADSMALLFPERCAGLIDIGEPHNFRPRDLPLVRPRADELIDKPAYNHFLQQPEIPEELLNNNVENFFRTFFQKGDLTSENLSKLPLNSPERKLDLSAMMSSKTEKMPLFVSEKDLRVYVDTYQKTGFDGGINWYRAMDISWKEMQKHPQHWALDIPYLYLWPAQDPINPQGLQAGLEDYIDNYQAFSIEDCGHFAMEEKPKKISHHIVNWLNQYFSSIKH
ncbi:alpha/beta fold hydrolase [Microbulbifer variabilis]|uniref:alpha/beta fold hydrolase n=1 Tax=Microbulbifer variabilis TaxID=266805 RepID=UPI001CFD6742|nr:alpha/beta hydrolase [Microbulbifer variabilis]